MQKVKVNLEMPVPVRDLLDLAKEETGLPITRIVGAALHHYATTMTDAQRIRAQKAFARWLSAGRPEARELSEGVEHGRKSPEDTPKARRRA